MNHTVLLVGLLCPIPLISPKPFDSPAHKTTCAEVRKQLRLHGSGFEMIDPVPDLLKNSGVTTDPNLLASGGTRVRGIAADGVTVVLLRFRANFPGERLQITLQGPPADGNDSLGGNGALAQIVNAGAARSGASLHFGFEPLTVTAVQTYRGTMAFALYRAPGDFVRDDRDVNRAARGISFHVRSLDLACFDVALGSVQF